jgi:hypothetical protein
VKRGPDLSRQCRTRLLSLTPSGRLFARLVWGHRWRVEALSRVDDVELQEAGKLVCGEDRCLRQLAVTAAVIRAVDRSGQHQLGRYQRDDGKAATTNRANAVSPSPSISCLIMCPVGSLLDDTGNASRLQT